MAMGPLMMKMEGGLLLDDLKSTQERSTEEKEVIHFVEIKEENVSLLLISEKGVIKNPGQLFSSLRLMTRSDYFKDEFGLFGAEETLLLKVWSHLLHPPKSSETPQEVLFSVELCEDKESENKVLLHPPIWENKDIYLVYLDIKDEKEGEKPILTSIVEESVQPTSPPPPPRLSTKIANRLISGAEAVSRVFVNGATKSAKFFDKSAAFLQSRMEPTKEPHHIKPVYKKGMKTAKTVTAKAVQVSGFVVNQLGKATLMVGRCVGPHLHAVSVKLLTITPIASDENEAAEKVDGVVEVGSGAVYSVGTVYIGITDAAKVFVSSLATNTINIVQFRYGEEAGEFATDTAATAGNAALTALNAKTLASKSMANKVARNTSKMYVKSIKLKEKSPVSTTTTFIPVVLNEPIPEVLKETIPP